MAGEAEALAANPVAKLERPPHHPEPPKAPRLAREGVVLARRVGARPAEAHGLCLAGDVASAHGAEDAEGYYREALKLACELTFRPRIAHCHLGLATLYRRTGNRERVEEHVTAATTMHREMKMSLWLERATKVAASR